MGLLLLLLFLSICMLLGRSAQVGGVDKLLYQGRKVTGRIAVILLIADYSEKEMAIEILLEAKGFNDVVASVSDTGVDIVVNKQSLETSQKAQIEDIAKRKTGMTSDKININVIK